MRLTNCAALLAIMVAFPSVLSAQGTSSARAETAVRAASNAWTAAAAARDANRMAEFFAEDAFVMYPRPAATIGRAANRDVWTEVFQRPKAVHPLTTDSVIVAASGDLAYTQGRWALSYDGAQGPVSSGGRYIAVWRPIAGEWRIVALSANAHRPPPDVTGPPD
jgi:ketosteroid isomerase-like protein